MENVKPKKAVRVGADGVVRDVLCDGVAAIQKAVGGNFETLFHTDRAVGFVNDRGSYGLPRNVRAERIAVRLGARLAGPVFGPLLLVGPDDRHGHQTHCREAVRRLAYEPLPDSPQEGDHRVADRESFAGAVAGRTWVGAGELRIDADLLAVITSRAEVSREVAVAALNAIWHDQAEPVIAGYEFGQAEVFPAHPSLRGLVFNFGVIDGHKLVSDRPFYPHRS